MTLIEVMLSVSLLLACVMVLSRVAFLAGKHATGAEDRTTEQIYCQNIMQELLAGLRPMQSVAPRAFEGDQWVYAIDVAAIEGSSLARVGVVVDRLEDSDAALPAEDELQGYRLVRWVRTDQVPGEQTLDGAQSPSAPLDESLGPEESSLE